MYHVQLFGLIMSKQIKVLIGKDIITLGDKEYLAQGGEGVVYRKGNVAFKIYHDPKKMIPEQKIRELQHLNIPTVLAPIDIIYDSNTRKAIGFTMPYLQSSEYLSRLFVKTFKKQNSITPSMVVDMVTKMQKTLQEIHKKGVIVGDYNEMNFLVDDNYKNVYNIDVDSYQTKNYPATAIMDSVRDRKAPFGKFSKETDWFSWAVVTFQLYTGIHPFKGRHPNYKNNDFDARMKDGVSVFNPDVKIPKALRDFSIIPKPHLEWYKRVFEKFERTIPPFADATQMVSGYAPIEVISASGLTVDLIHNYLESIIDLYMFDGNRYVITEKAIYKHDKPIFDFTRKPKDICLARVMGHDPVIGVKRGLVLGFFDLNRNEIGQVAADDFMTSNGYVYCIRNDGLFQHHFMVLGKTKLVTKKLASIVSNSSKLYEGVVIQDLFGKMRLTIPYEFNKVANITVPELNGYRMIDASCKGRFCVIIAESKGVYDRFVIYFSEDFKSYDIETENDISYRTVNFMVKQNGMAIISKDGNTLEMRYDVAKGCKEISDAPIEDTMQLHDGITEVLFVNGSKLQCVKS